MRKPTRLRLHQFDACQSVLVAAVALSLPLVVAGPVGGDEPTKVSARTIAGPAAGLGGPAAPREHPLQKFIRVAGDSRDALNAVRDYEATFTKSEVVGRTVYADTMAIKFRDNPFSVYLRFYGKNEGREVLYFAGRNQGKLVAHEPPGTLRGFIGTISLDPKSGQAMAEGRHPITRIGMRNMVEALIKQWEAETQYGETETQYFPDAKLRLPGKVIECKVLESTHPQPRRQFLFHKSRLWIEKSTNFPIRVEQFGFPDRLHPEPFEVEQYTYTNIRPNVGLTDADFDVRNRSYKF
jgi:hypothetical protein